MAKVQRGSGLNVRGPKLPALSLTLECEGSKVASPFTHSG